MTDTEKNIDTVVEDIYSLFQKKDHKVSDENLETFKNNISKILKERLETTRETKKPTLRASNIGLGDRKLWYEINSNEDIPDQTITNPSLNLRFLYGDLIEELVLFLVKEAGHSVSEEQEEIEIEGIKGHKDCKIDGVTTDIKSVSNYSYNKFSRGELFNNDPFGYISQISFYSYKDENPFGAFLAMNKETGQLSLLKVPTIDMVDPEHRIKYLKETVELNTPPENKCYEPKDLGKKGNKVLHPNCTYCRFKNDCWKDANNGKGLRKFRYSNGIKEFVEVVDTPRVEEIFHE